MRSKLLLYMGSKRDTALTKKKNICMHISREQRVTDNISERFAH